MPSLVQCTGRRCGLRHLVELLGDGPVSAVTKDQMRDLLPLIKGLPSNFNKRFPGRTAREVLGETKTMPNPPRRLACWRKATRRTRAYC